MCMCIVADTWVKELGDLADEKGIALAARIVLTGGAISLLYYFLRCGIDLIHLYLKMRIE